jgi:hypothetical protein
MAQLKPDFVPVADLSEDDIGFLIGIGRAQALLWGASTSQVEPRQPSSLQPIPERPNQHWLGLRRNRTESVRRIRGLMAVRRSEGQRFRPSLNTSIR